MKCALIYSLAPRNACSSSFSQLLFFPLSLPLECDAFRGRDGDDFGHGQMGQEKGEEGGRNENWAHCHLRSPEKIGGGRNPHSIHWHTDLQLSTAFGTSEERNEEEEKEEGRIGNWDSGDEGMEGAQKWTAVEWTG